MSPKWRILSVIISIAVSASISTGSVGASFDCAKAQSFRERTVCANSQLSRLDEMLASDYRGALVSSKNPEELKLSERTWMVRANGCVEVTCLVDAYSERISQLQNVGPTDAVTPDLPQGTKSVDASVIAPEISNPIVSQENRASMNGAKPSSNIAERYRSAPAAASNPITAKNVVRNGKWVSPRGSHKETPWVLWSLGIASIVGGLMWAVFKTNNYCDEKFYTRPFNFLITGILATGLLLLIASYFIYPNGSRGMFSLSLAGHSNYYILLALGIFLPIACLIYLAIKTNPWIAIFATVLQLILAPLALIALAVVVMVGESRAGGGGRLATGVASTSSSGGNATSPKYAVQQLPPGRVQWQNAGYLGGAMNQAMSVAQRVKAKNPTFAVRIVEKHGDIDGGIVYSL